MRLRPETRQSAVLNYWAPGGFTMPQERRASMPSDQHPPSLRSCQVLRSWKRGSAGARGRPHGVHQRLHEHQETHDHQHGLVFCKERDIWCRHGSDARRLGRLALRAAAGVAFSPNTSWGFSAAVTASCSRSAALGFPSPGPRPGGCPESAIEHRGSPVLANRAAAARPPADTWPRSGPSRVRAPRWRRGVRVGAREGVVAAQSSPKLTTGYDAAIRGPKRLLGPQARSAAS